MKDESHWRTALPTYLKLSFSYAVMLSIAPLAIALLANLWTRVSTGHWDINRAGIAHALIFGAFFFFLRSSQLSARTFDATGQRRNAPWRGILS
jgi:hypothetical protein